jgi:hypothetical protein
MAPAFLADVEVHTYALGQAAADGSQVRGAISAAEIQDPEAAGPREALQDFALYQARTEAADEAAPVLEVGLLPRGVSQFDGGRHLGR